MLQFLGTYEKSQTDNLQIPEAFMEPDDKALAEKMRARLHNERERQRRWRQRQQDQGRKSVSAMLSREACAILQEERERTGERVSDILERAVMALAPGQKTDVVISNVENDVLEPVEDEGDIFQESIQLFEQIVALREVEHLPFNEIAHRLNEEGIPSPDGFVPWQGRQVYDLYRRVAEED
jgi:hypothetical protein